MRLATPRARTVLGLELTNGRVAIVAETTGPVSAASASEEATPIRADRNAGAGDGARRNSRADTRRWRVSCRFPLDERVGR